MKATLALIGALAAAPAAAEPPALADLLLQVGKYVRGFQHDFATVIGDETYLQRERYAERVNGREKVSTAERTMRSEMLFLWMPQERDWLAVRNVLAVDGRNVSKSQERLDRLFASEAAIGVAKLRKMRDEGARFNIGTIRRNFNDPMFPLQFLEPPNQRRFTFTLAGAEQVGGVTTSKIKFEERARPTFIQDGRTDLPSHGEVCVAPDGSVMRTRLQIQNADRYISAFVMIDYRREASLDMLVPAKMQEVYAAGAPYERVNGVATYSNFRRFETSARIVPDR